MNVRLTVNNLAKSVVVTHEGSRGPAGLSSYQLYILNGGTLSLEDYIADQSANAAAATAAAIQTAADRIQTGLDAAATAADRAAADIDAAQTASDRIQTGLDRAQTGADANATEAYKDLAEAAAALAQSVAAGNLTSADSRAAAILMTIPASISYMRTAGYAVAGDGGGALYIKVGSQPTHGGKFRSADGAWWELAEDIVTPEMFGAMGRISGPPVNENTAMMGMGDYGRAKNRLYVRLKSGTIYSYVNPLFLTGIRGALKIDGWGASFQNCRATVLGADVTFANNECLSFPSVFYELGQNLYGSSSPQYAYGQLIDTTLAGSTVIPLSVGQSNADFVIGERVMIFGCATQTAGFPNTSLFFEYGTVTAISGQNITLASPLKFSYYSDFPVVATDHAYGGPPRMISLYRNGKHHETENVEINGLHLMADPAWLAGAGGTINRNGRATWANYERCILNKVTGDGGIYVSQGGWFTDNGGKFLGSVEDDKFGEIAEHFGVDYGAFAQGTGIYKVTIAKKSTIHALSSAEALDTLLIEDSDILGQDFVGSAAIAGTFGTPRTIIRNNRMGMNSSATSLRAANARTAAFTQVSATRLDMTTALYKSSNMLRNLRPGSVLYNVAGEPVFKVTAPAREAALRVFFDGYKLGGAFTSGDTLYCPIFPVVDAVVPNFYTGANPERIETAVTSQSIMYAKKLDPDNNNGVWTIRSSYYPLLTNATQRSFFFGYLVDVARVSISIIKPYTGVSPNPQLRLRRDLAGANLAVINLATIGTRILDVSGNSGIQTGDTVTGIGAGPMGLVSYLGTTALAYADRNEAALWSIAFFGSQIVE